MDHFEEQLCHSYSRIVILTFETRPWMWKAPFFLGRHAADGYRRGWTPSTPRLSFLPGIDIRNSFYAAHSSTRVPPPYSYRLSRHFHKGVTSSALGSGIYLTSRSALGWRTEVILSRGMEDGKGRGDKKVECLDIVNPNPPLMRRKTPEGVRVDAGSNCGDRLG